MYILEKNTTISLANICHLTWSQLFFFFLVGRDFFKLWIFKVFFFLMWTIFKVFIEFVSILLLFLSFVFLTPRQVGF